MKSYLKRTVFFTPIFVGVFCDKSTRPFLTPWILSADSLIAYETQEWI